MTLLLAITAGVLIGFILGIVLVEVGFFLHWILVKLIMLVRRIS
jgi:hypothetical protein